MSTAVILFDLLCYSAHFVVLVGGDSHELSSRKDKHVMLALAHVPNVTDMVGLHDMKPWLILVHTIHNNLKCSYVGVCVCVCVCVKG